MAITKSQLPSLVPLKTIKLERKQGKEKKRKTPKREKGTKKKQSTQFLLLQNPISNFADILNFKFHVKLPQVPRPQQCVCIYIVFIPLIEYWNGKNNNKTCQEED